jgi:hypothetical protein
VAWTDRAPFAGHAFRTISTNASPVTFSVKAVSSDYFEALGIRLVSGRPFTSEEVTERRGVLIISESVAKRYWPGEDPVGRTVADHPWLERDDSQHSTIVGVVRDVRATYLSRIDNALYYPQTLDARASLLIRTRGPAAAGSHSILAGLATLDPRLAAEAEVTPMDGGPLRGQRMMSTIPAALAAALALIGLLLAAVGLYGVVAQMVVRRTREIGVRVALGASRRQVTQMVLGRSLRPALWGTGAGFLGILGTSALFDAMLSAPDAPDLTYGRGTFDPVTFGLVLLVLGLTICLGSIGPARRALRVDPMVALRYE